MPRKRSVTANDLVSELQRDPSYMERRGAAARRGDEAAADEAGLVRELNAASIQVSSVYDFVNTVVTPIAAAPILLRHLDLPHKPVIREGLLRALTYSHLRPVALNRLLDLYRAAPDVYERWLLANAIGTMTKFNEVSKLPGIAEYRALFRRTPRKRRPRQR